MLEQASRDMHSEASLSKNHLSCSIGFGFSFKKFTTTVSTAHTIHLELPLRWHCARRIDAIDSRPPIVGAQFDAIDIIVHHNSAITLKLH